MGPQGIWKPALGDTAFRRLLKLGWAPNRAGLGLSRGKTDVPGLVSGFYCASSPFLFLGEQLGACLLLCT